MACFREHTGCEIVRDGFFRNESHETAYGGDRRDHYNPRKTTDQCVFIPARLPLLPAHKNVLSG